MSPDNFANGTALHFALREMRGALASPAVWIGLIAVGSILGLAGPFGTDDIMRLVPRLAYWIVVAAVTYFSGTFVTSLVAEAARRQAVPKWRAVGLAGVIAGAVIALEMGALNLMVFGPDAVTVATFATLIGNVILISVIVSFAFVAISDRLSSKPMPGHQPTNAAGPPPLLARLPHEKRGALVSLSVEDHYVNVVTDQGTEMVLMRLRDAIGETGATPGLQIHRSHWIALAEVAKVRRQGQRAIVRMKDGRELPASRTYIAALKDAGLLPR